MLIRFLFIAGCLSLFTYWSAIRTTPEDALNYKKLAKESLELRTRHALKENPAHQIRFDVQKQIWTKERMRHFQIQSQKSELTLSQKKEKLEAVEELEHILCTVENGFTLTADQGLYTYPSHRFIAKRNCRLAQDQNFIDGEKIEMDFMNETLFYERPKGFLKSSNIAFKAEKLLWDKKKELLYLYDSVIIEQPEQFTLLANRGVLDLMELQPKLITLDGNVRLISSRIQGKPSYALADQLAYDPLNKTLLFSAEKKVLFWQEGLTLSAPSILIKKDQTIEGHGDVHFAFDLEEQNYIDQFFRKYL